MISNGAGSMVQGIDLLKQNGLEMPELSAATLRGLAAVYPPYYIVQNPIDVTGSGTSTDYEHGIEAMLKDPNIDIAMPWFVFQDTPLEEDIVQKLGRLTRGTTSRSWLVGWAGHTRRRWQRPSRRKGFPSFSRSATGSPRRVAWRSIR